MCPSNREGSKDSFGGSGLSSFFSCRSLAPISLEVRAYDLHQFIRCDRLPRGRFARGIEHATTARAFENTEAGL